MIIFSLIAVAFHFHITMQTSEKMCPGPITSATQAQNSKALRSGALLGLLYLKA